MTKEFPEQIHPNDHDANITTLACYLLNDIILGTIFGDKELGRERNELVMPLDGLSNGTDFK